jgi:hypothetical protein
VSIVVPVGMTNSCVESDSEPGGDSSGTLRTVLLVSDLMTSFRCELRWDTGRERLDGRETGRECTSFTAVLQFI